MRLRVRPQQAGRIRVTRRAILLIGQEYWINNLAKGLAEAGLPVQVAPLNSVRHALTPATWKALAGAAVVVRVGLRPGASTWRGLAFDVAMSIFARGGATKCCYWIGTDVAKVAEDVGIGRRVAAWRSPAFAADQHLAGSKPLGRELATAGLGARVVAFPLRFTDAPAFLPPLPDDFTVLTYVPDNRSDFYGGPTLLEAASRLPEVRFEVMGGEGSWVRTLPPNVHFLGWVSNTTAVYSRASCVLRLAAHDSIGGTAVEGLLFGRPVVYQQDLRYREQLEYTENVDGTCDSVVTAIESLLRLHKIGFLEADEKASSWARKEFDHMSRFSELASRLLSLTESVSTRQPRLTYLTLQGTSVGQAAHAHVHEIVKGLAETGWCVRLLEPDYRGGHASVSRRLMQFSRIQVAALCGLRRSDVLYVRSHFAAFPIAVAARLLGVPVVQEVNGSNVEAILVWPGLRRLRKATAWLQRSQLRMADAVITVTPQLVRWIAQDAGVAGVNLISNGADPERFYPGLPVPVGLPKRFVVFFGTLAPWQGVDVAIAATRTDVWPEGVKLVILGDGPLRQDVEIASRDGRVVYLGTRSYDEVPAIVSNSIASLIPLVPISRENHSSNDYGAMSHAPLKLFESMASGIPVIVSDHPGCAETVTAARCGVLVEPGNPNAIADAVRTFSDSPDLAKEMGDLGRESAVRDHSWKSRANETADLLQSIGGKRSRP